MMTPEEFMKSLENYYSDKLLLIHQNNLEYWLFTEI
jgi:hypothetical protein